jgi:hypothetical protein
VTWSRLAALALTIPLLHLNIVRADAACDQHETAPAHSAMQHEMPAGDMAAHHHGTPAEKADQSCDTPVQVDCCQAVLSCSPGLGELTVAAVGVAQASHAVTARPIAMPLSRVTPPEPPPPRS